jgi:hypothetical protein
MLRGLNSRHFHSVRTLRIPGALVAPREIDARGLVLASLATVRGDPWLRFKLRAEKADFDSGVSAGGPCRAETLDSGFAIIP